MAVKQGQRRNSGETTADEVSKELAAQNDKLVTEDITQKEVDEDRRRWRTPAFQRMRLEWSGPDEKIVRDAIATVEGRLVKDFVDAYEVMNEVYELVRAPEIDPLTSQPVRDQWGYVVWKRTPSGGYDEDWTRLTSKQRENLLFKITTRIFEWYQRADNVWTEAMFAKAQWEERFSIKFDEPASGTVDDRTAKGRMGAAEERYFAIFLSAYSRKADHLVRTMELLGQRLKDSMGQ